MRNVSVNLILTSLVTFAVSSASYFRRYGSRKCKSLAYGTNRLVYETITFVAENAPSEILDKGQRALEAYFRASRHGTRPVNRTRIMLVGQERVGKTSLMRTLLGLRYEFVLLALSSFHTSGVLFIRN